MRDTGGFGDNRVDFVHDAVPIVALDLIFLRDLCEPTDGDINLPADEFFDRLASGVLGLLGLFYLFPAVYAALGRVLTPELYVSGETDSVVLELPARMVAVEPRLAPRLRPPPW